MLNPNLQLLSSIFFDTMKSEVDPSWDNPKYPWDPPDQRVTKNVKDRPLKHTQQLLLKGFCGLLQNRVKEHDSRIRYTFCMKS